MWRGFEVIMDNIVTSIWLRRVLVISLEFLFYFSSIIKTNSIWLRFEGEIPITHYLIGKNYPTSRLYDRIETVSNSMMENGLYQFHIEHRNYLANMKIEFELSQQHSSENDGGDLRALTMVQMIRPFYLVVGLLAMSVLVFIGEIIHFKWMTRRDEQ